MPTDRIRPPGATRLIAFVSPALLLAGQVGFAQVPLPPSTFEERPPPEIPRQMPEEIRAEIRNVVVIAGQRPTEEELSGSYERETLGLSGGMDAGSRVGTISTEVGPVPVSYTIPVVSYVGAVIGAIAGATQRELQQLRDAMAEQLAKGENTPLTNDGIALDTFWGLQNLPDLESRLFAATTPIPEDTDAILYVAILGVGINIDGSDAILTTTAGVTLQQLKPDRNRYETTIRYQDRDSLKNWTADGNALWRSYSNFARHYLGREVAADVYDRVLLDQEFQPRESHDVEKARRTERRFESESLAPTLAWELDIGDANPAYPWAATIDPSAIRYDVEVYDARQLVYAQEQVAGNEHTLMMELEPCGAYWWSVRPSYHVGNSVYFGDWMRFTDGLRVVTDNDSNSATLVEEEKGLFGREASVAPAYVQDFSTLEIECRRR